MRPRVHARVVQETVVDEHRLDYVPNRGIGADECSHPQPVYRFQYGLDYTAVLSLTTSYIADRKDVYARCWKFGRVICTYIANLYYTFSYVQTEVLACERPAASRRIRAAMTEKSNLDPREPPHPQLATPPQHRETSTRCCTQHT